MRIINYNCDQGDHYVLVFDENCIGIVDFKLYPSEPFPRVCTYITKYLEKHSEIEILFICISHYDYDHIDGLGSFLDFVEGMNHDQVRITIKNIWLAGSKSQGGFRKQILNKVKASRKLPQLQKEEIKHLLRNYDTRLDKLEKFIYKWEKETGIKAETIDRIRDIKNPLLPKIKVFSFGPMKDYCDTYDMSNILQLIWDLMKVDQSKVRIDNNLISTILFLEKENSFRFCFGGDASIEMWQDSFTGYSSIRDSYDLNSNFIKASHHGSKNSSDIELWRSLIHDQKKTIISFSAGDNNIYGHPHNETFEHIKKSGKDNYWLFSTNDLQNIDQCSKGDADKIRNLKILDSEHNELHSSDSIEDSNSQNLFAYEFKYDSITGDFCGVTVFL